ncbi:hypothetical protein FKP32DRAFT_1108173 [Trametes sanguinea]|nr:hypothetical protein FKP32DRAFT_1108173 [Trametes sanguinea]
MRETNSTVEPEHEIQVRPYGFASSFAFAKAMGDWIEAHNVALQMSTQEFVLQHGDVDFADIPSRDLTAYRLVCRTQPGQSAAERNPATKFAARMQCLANIEEWKSLDAGNARAWEGALAGREQIAQRLSRVTVSTGTPPCVMSALLKCDGVTIGTVLHLPLIHVRRRIPLDRASRDILADIITLCYRSMDQGFPLQFGSLARVMPLPGRFSRKAGKWLWEPFFADWDDYSPTSQEYPALHSAIAAFKTGMSPKQLLEAFMSL